MTTGRSIYNELNNKVSEVKQEVDSISRKLNLVENNIGNLMNDREENLIAMAKFYLPELNANTIEETIKEKQGVVQALFREKQKRRNDLENAITSSYNAKLQLDSDLQKLDEKLDNVKADRDLFRDKYLELLDNDSQYKELVIQNNEMSKRIELNSTRVAEITKESNEKLPEFENNNLFSYLLRKNFGTEKYHALNIIKKLDTWVAKLVDYTNNKQKYDTLRAMPELMNIELDKRKEELNVLVAKGKAIEETYANEAGLTRILSIGKELQEQRNKLSSEIDSYIAKNRQYTQEKESLNSTKDVYHQKAIAELKSYLKGESIAELKQRAQETSSLEDDKIVNKMEQIDEQVRMYKNSAKELQEQLNSKTKKFNELEELVSKFRRNNYDDSDSRFRSGLDVNSLISGYLLGRLSDDDIWRDMSNKHYVEEPYHSSSSSYSSSSSSSYSSGSDSWGSSGGFSSGGGFGGGGGFSSGGGF